MCLKSAIVMMINFLFCRGESSLDRPESQEIKSRKDQEGIHFFVESTLQSKALCVGTL